MDKENNNLSNEEKKKLKEDYYSKVTKKRADEKIKEIETYSGKKLNEYDKNLITKREGRKVKREMRIKLLKGFLFGISATALFGGGVYAGHEMADFNQDGKVIESVEDNGQDLLVKRFEQEGQEFRQGIQDSGNNLIELKRSVSKEVESLQTKETIEDYLKDMCKEDYNQNNGTKIKEVLNVIGIHGRIGYEDQITYYEDEAKNGDSILRKTTFNDAKEIGVNPVTQPEPVLKMLFETEEGERKTEYAVLYNGQYVTLYDNEEVYEYSDNTLVNMGKVIDAGIELWDSITEENEIDSEKQTELINAVVEYKTSEIENQSKQITKSTIQENEEERE